MNIRRAVLEDAGDICQIANSLKIDFNNPSNEGFLVYPLNLKEYSDRINLSDFFYVAEIENKIIGFLMCYSKEVMLKLLKLQKLSYEDNLINELLKNSKKFVFGDQIAIINNQKFKGMGTQLIKHLFNEMDENNISDFCVGILHEPILNIASKKFCEKLGLICKKEVKNTDNTLWGIYEVTKSTH